MIAISPETSLPTVACVGGLRRASRSRLRQRCLAEVLRVLSLEDGVMIARFLSALDAGASTWELYDVRCSAGDYGRRTHVALKVEAETRAGGFKTMSFAYMHICWSD